MSSADLTLLEGYRPGPGDEVVFRCICGCGAEVREKMPTDLLLMGLQPSPSRAGWVSWSCWTVRKDGGVSRTITLHAVNGEHVLRALREVEEDPSHALRREYDWLEGRAAVLTVHKGGATSDLAG